MTSAPSAPVAVVVLAAGQGTRMRSSLPKVLHEVAGRPMGEHVLRAARTLEPERLVVVVGHGADAVRARLGADDVTFVEQERQLGTGDALRCAGRALAGFRGTVLVLNGDAPLIDGATLRQLVQEQQAHRAPVLLTCEVDDPHGLGRVVRDPHGAVERIVEEKDASADERALREIYPGLFAFDEGVLARVERLGNDNRAGEYYLTDLVALYRGEGHPVRAVRGTREMARVVGVNTRAELANAERVVRERIRRRWLDAGVTMRGPETTFVDDEVVLERDVVLEPGVLLRGATRVGEGATVGAYAVLCDCRVAPGARVAPHTVATGETFEPA